VEFELQLVTGDCNVAYVRFCSLQPAVPSNISLS